MIRLLSMIIFLPILGVHIFKRFLPSFTGFLLQRRYPISLVIFTIINLGVFSKYSQYFRQEPGILIRASVVALILSGILFVLGIIAIWWTTPEDRIASAISVGNMNNVLIIVFSSRFFGPLEATVAAMYMFPFFLIIFPLRACERIFSVLN
jgi:BASS family bile acid:Na+ symporter